MSGEELEDAYVKGPDTRGESVIAVANAALRHAVDAGQVLLPSGDVRQALKLLDFLVEQLEPASGCLENWGTVQANWRGLRAATFAAVGVTGEKK